MKFIAYGYKIGRNDADLIQRMGQVVTDQQLHIKDLRSYECDSTDEDVLLIFGDRAKMICSHAPALAKVHLPDVSKLHAQEVETQERLEAAEILYKLRDAIDNDTLNELNSSSKPVVTTKEVKSTAITESDLPDLTADSLKALEKNLRKQGKTGFQGVTQNGKSIYVSILPEESSADIVMTFSELYAVRLLMEALHVRELQVVYKSAGSSKQNPSK